MVWPLVALSVAQGAVSYGTQLAQAENQRKVQEYNNRVAREAAKNQQEAIAINKIRRTDALQEGLIESDLNRRRARAQLVTQAAHAGAIGQPLDLMISEIEQNAAKAESNQRKQFKYDLQNYDQQIKQVESQRRSRTDLRQFNDPSMLATALDIGGSVYEAGYGTYWGDVPAGGAE